jgi:hypothetical protein
MRHFVGFLIGLVVTAGVLFGGGWATRQAMVEAETPTTSGNVQLWIALGAMAGIGLVLGLVVAGRISPLATFLPSMALLAWTVVYALDMNRALSLVPDEPSMHELILQAGQGMQALLTSGVFALLGVALFLPVLMPSRWAGRQDDDDDEEYEEQTQTGGYFGAV